MLIEICEVEKRIARVRDMNEVKRIFDEVLENYPAFNKFKLKSNSSSIEVFLCNEIVSHIDYLISPQMPKAKIEINTPFGNLTSFAFLNNEDNFIKYISYLKFSNRV